ncbi:MAG TPA: hypothetical protein VIG97_05865 [Luteimonas sp.]
MLAIVLLPGISVACEPAGALEGVMTIPHCDPTIAGDGCVPSAQAVHEAMEALEIPGAFTIGVQTSPWRMYDGEGRILTVQQVADAVRKQRDESDTRVYLIGSWTDQRPDGGGDTLAKRLSDALDGFTVDGTDGFLWLTPDGGMRTTRQAFSVWKTGPYSVGKGDDVLAPLVPGAMAQFEDRFAELGRMEGVVQAGVGYDVFLLCPERALAAFERAAGMGSAIGTYNAGLIHVQEGELSAAMAWLERASSLGEEKAVAALEALRLHEETSPL